MLYINNINLDSLIGGIGLYKGQPSSNPHLVGVWVGVVNILGLLLCREVDLNHDIRPQQASLPLSQAGHSGLGSNNFVIFCQLSWCMIITSNSSRVMHKT